MFTADFCPKCNRPVDTVEVQKAGLVEWRCKRCGTLCDQSYEDDDEWAEWDFDGSGLTFGD